MRTLTIIAVSICVVACGSNSSSPPPKLSSGKKIFVTAIGHIGDFQNDPLLAGSNAIEKADSFCNNDANKPDDSTYKALIVDGINRDAISLTDWVLKPNTTYYRPYDDVEIGTTIDTAILPVLNKELTNSVAEKRTDSTDGFHLNNVVYTGISEASNYATDGAATCNNWSSATKSYSANWGRIYETTTNAISTDGLIACDYIAPLYCVEQ